MAVKIAKQDKSAKKRVSTSKSRTAARMGRSRDNQKNGPVEIIESTNDGRLIDLVPIRHSRMLVSPFTYYRGAAAVMAADLDRETNSGIVVQSCGDCHSFELRCFRYTRTKHNYRP